MHSYVLTYFRYTCFHIHRLVNETTPQNLPDLIKILEQKILAEEVSILVRRDHVLEDAIRSMKRKNFPFDHKLKVGMQYACNISLVLHVRTIIILAVHVTRCSFLGKLVRMRVVLEESSGHYWEKKLNIHFLKEKDQNVS